MTIRLMTLYVVLVVATCGWSFQKATADEPTTPQPAAQAREPITVVLELGRNQVLLGRVQVPANEAEISVAQVLEQLKKDSPNLIHPQPDAKLVALRTQRVVDDDLTVRQRETGRDVEKEDRLLPVERLVIKPSLAGLPTIRSTVGPDGQQQIEFGRFDANGKPIYESPAVQLPPGVAVNPLTQTAPVVAYGPPPATQPYRPAGVTIAYAPAAPPGTPAPSATSSSTAAPFFGNTDSNPAGVQFRKVVEEVLDPSGQKHTVERSIAELVSQQVIVRFQIFVDEKDSMGAFAHLRDGGILMGDAATISGTLKILETNELITSIGRPTINCTVGRPANFMLGETKQMGPTPDSPPRLVDGIQVDVMPQNVGGALRLEYRVKLAEFEKIREITALVEFGRGQMAIVPMTPRRKPIAAATADDPIEVKPIYVAILPELVQAQAHSPMPAPPAVGPPIATEAQWLAPTQAMPQPSAIAPQAAAAPNAPPSPQFAVPAAATAPVSMPSTVPSTPIPAMRYEATPAAFPTPRPAAASEPAADENLLIKYEIGLYEDPTGSLAEFMPPASQPQSKVTDAATIGTSLRVLEKQKLIRRISSPKLAAASGQQAVMQVSAAGNGQAESGNGFKIDLLGRKLGGVLAIDYNSVTTIDDRQRTVGISQLVTEGQAIITRAESRSRKQDGENAAAPVETPVYVVITPEIVR